MIQPIHATPAPALRRQYGHLFGFAAAALLILFAVVHLIRIDTFVPELSYALPVSERTASLFALLLICSEVFALPFLLRMSLSPLARFLSGLLVVTVPLVWLLIAIWNYGSQISTAQLGEFHSLPSGMVLIGFNVLWLALNYATLWVLGFDIPKRLSKLR